MASEDAFDRGTFILAGLFAGEAQLTNDNRAFGQGGAGFGQYYGAAYGDLLIGDYMTQAIFPTFLHQDPRYFRRGVGSTRSRLAYAIGKIFWTQRDSGGTQFNYSEIIGNYYFRPRVVWRVVRKPVFNSVNRRRLAKEAREYLSLRSKRKQLVRERRKVG